MSLMTAVSGGSSLLLLMIPRKYEAGEVLDPVVVTCCETENCVGDYSPHNLSLPTCLPAGKTCQVTQLCHLQSLLSYEIDYYINEKRDYHFLHLL